MELPVFAKLGVSNLTIRIKSSKHSTDIFGRIHICNIEPSSPGAIVLLCVGEVQCTGSAGGSTSLRTARGGEQRLTNRVGATKGGMMLYLETHRLCSLLCFEPK